MASTNASMGELLYVGMKGGIEERIVPAHGIPLIALPLTTPEGLRRTAIAAVQIGIGTLRSLLALARFRPHVLFSTGGFVSLPATIAAWLARIPIVVYLPDVQMGRSVALSARFARRVAVTTQESTSFPGSTKVTVTGYPVRRGFIDMDRAQARERLGLTPDERVLLVMGGSLGARAINQAVVVALPELLHAATIIHVCGIANYDEIAHVFDGLPSDIKGRYRLKPFLDEMDMAVAMFAADLAVTRAGASILGELPVARLPAIVVPLPAGRVHQDANATALSSRGGCVILANEELPAGGLAPLVHSLLEDSERRRTMRVALEQLSRPGAAEDIARIIISSARGTTS